MASNTQPTLASKNCRLPIRVYTEAFSAIIFLSKCALRARKALRVYGYPGFPGSRFCPQQPAAFS